MQEFTQAEKVMLTALATQVVVDRLTRGKVVGHTSSGRVKMELPRSEATEAERAWFRLQAQYTPQRSAR